MKIWIYYHIAQLKGWEELVSEKIELIREHGLWDAADKIVLQMHYEPEDSDAWLSTRPDLTSDPKIQIVKHIPMFGIEGIRPSARPVGEVYSIRELHDDCLSDPDNHAVFHMHTKGITHRWDESWPAAQKWNLYLEYWNIHNWRLCLEGLKAGYDTVGVNWQHACWSGTIWWASTKWIKQIPLLKWPHEVGFQKQLGGWSAMHDAEHWIGQGNPRYLELNHFEHAVDYRWWPEPENYKFKD